ncbi:immunity protein YezG family protein [Paenibacillus sp. P46E]|uniref:immunity protein YezG family protein n=1 Tax=Paenibacillus sp. P46E TaxID=1349436 RepID=UPI00273D06BB|nr:immunity protein YezG family protein [Paenibacillus sp. P46E]
MKVLIQVIIDNDQEPWTNLTLTLKSPGKMNIIYDYEDVLASKILPSQRQMVFEYQNLGMFPQNERDRLFLY